MFWFKTQKDSVCTTHRRRNSSVSTSIYSRELTCILTLYRPMPQTQWAKHSRCNKISFRIIHGVMISIINKSEYFRSKNSVWCLLIQFDHNTWHQSPKRRGEKKQIFLETLLLFIQAPITSGEWMSAYRIWSVSLAGFLKKKKNRSCNLAVI